ncbi:hypothetical protein OSTOST_01146 [Ostertagia ostertagi]
MPSYSEPPTPIHEVDYYCTQLETSSCDDINNLKPLGKSRVLASARYNCLKTKREEIARFLKDHANENLEDYIMYHTFHGSLQNTTSKHETDDEEELRSHPEWNQVAMDVHRTLARFPPNISDEKRSTLQDQLIPLIVRVLRANPRFRYYQDIALFKGFHDVCLTVILVCGKETAFEVCKNLATHGPFRSYLLKSLEKSVRHFIQRDPQLERVLREVHLGTMFALKRPFTWLGHRINHLPTDCTVFDVFLASPPLTPIYVCAAVVLKRKSAILTSEREMPIIHQLLMNMPNEIHLDAILSDSLYLSSLMPPLALKTEFTRLYRERVKARAINQRWAPVSRYAITMVAAVGIAGAAYYFNLGSRFSLSM